jgi:hypothetical protein
MLVVTKGEEMLKTSDWATERCEKHDMVSCADCLASARMRRDETGQVRFGSDCTVATFVEITGMDYDFAAEVLREAGFVPGRGAAAAHTVAAFESVGYTVKRCPFATIESATLASTTGHKFFVSSTMGRNGHAFSITDGKANRNFFAGRRYRYTIFEII